MTLDTPLDYALAYAGAGYRIIPANGKIPLVEHGAHDASAEEATLRQWWAKWPTANIGLVLDGFVAIDIDPRNGGDVAQLRRDRIVWQRTVGCVSVVGGYRSAWHCRDQYDPCNQCNE